MLFFSIPCHAKRKRHGGAKLCAYCYVPHCANSLFGLRSICSHWGSVVWFSLNPRPTKLFFVTWFTKGVVTTPLMNLKLMGPKYDCLVPWYRVGAPLSIDTKIMKISQRMTFHWRFQTWPDSKSGFSVKIDQNWKKINFLLKKFQISEFHPLFCL